MTTAKVLKRGRSQTVRLPPSCRLEGNEVLVQKFGPGFILLPKKHGWALLDEALADAAKISWPKRDQPKASRQRDLSWV